MNAGQYGYVIGNMCHGLPILKLDSFKINIANNPTLPKIMKIPPNVERNVGRDMSPI
jgi:hypothetical protein